jgi:hypothetical protein
MVKPQLSWLKVLILAAACAFYSLTLTAADETNLTKDQIKQFLTNAKVIADHSAKKGITDTKRLTLSDGTITHDASFQAVDEHKAKMTTADGRTEMNFVDSYKYNIAAYVLAELVGFDDMIPVYVERKWNGHTGSLSWWVDVKMDDVERIKQKIDPPDPDKWNNQMYKVRVFDQLVYDTDPNLTNVLIGPDWKLWRIDFSRSFRTYHDLKAPKDLVKCDKQLFAKLKALNGDEFAEKSKRYLSKDEIKAVMARRDKIVQLFEKQIAEKGESAVLY